MRSISWVRKNSRRLLKNRCSHRTDICHLLVVTHSLTHISHNSTFGQCMTSKVLRWLWTQLTGTNVNENLLLRQNTQLHWANVKWKPAIETEYTATSSKCKWKPAIETEYTATSSKCKMKTCYWDRVRDHNSLMERASSRRLTIIWKGSPTNLKPPPLYPRKQNPLKSWPVHLTTTSADSFLTIQDRTLRCLLLMQ